MSNLLLNTGLDFRSPKAYYLGSTTKGEAMATFAEKLRQLREAAGMTQEALARAIDMSLSIVRDYEQGRKEPSLRSALKLAAALGVSCEAFKGCIDEAPSPPTAPKRRKKK